MPEMARIGREGKDLDEREEGARAGKRGEGRGMIGEVCPVLGKIPQYGCRGRGDVRPCSQVMVS